MDRKLWTEARAIAARQRRRARRRPGAGSGGARRWRTAGAARAPGGLAGARGAERGRSIAGGSSSGAPSWRRRSSRRRRPPIRRRRCWGASGGGWCGGRWRRCRGRSGGRRWRGFTPSSPTRRWRRGWARRRSPPVRASTARSPACGRGWERCARCSFFPGAQMSALGLVFMATAAPGLTPARALSVDEISIAAPRAGRHFARTRVMAAASPAPAAGSAGRACAQDCRLAARSRPTPRLRRSGWCSARTSSKGASSGRTKRSSDDHRRSRSHRSSSSGITSCRRC